MIEARSPRTGSNDRTRIAVLRADGSPKLGFGHLIRSLALIQEFRSRGWNTYLATRRDGIGSAASGALLKDLLVGVKMIDLKDGEELVPRRLRDEVGGDIDALIVDHYGLDRRFESAFAGVTDCRVVIDDLADRSHACDILVDIGGARVSGDYADLVEPETVLLLGPAYALLRPGFAASRMKSLRRDRRPLRHIVVVPGATDASGAALPILEALDAASHEGGDFGVTVILSRAARSLTDVRDWLGARPANWNLALDVADMAEPLSRTDLAVGAAGGGSWERACLGVPSIAVVAAANQQANSRFLAARGVAVSVTDGPDLTTRVKDALSDLLREPERLSKMSLAGACMVDGDGCVRIADRITDFLDGTERDAGTAGADNLEIRAAGPDDCEQTYRWQTAAGMRRFFRNPEPPSLDEHKSWFAEKLAGGTDHLLMVEDGERVAVGFIRLAPREEDDSLEVSILVAPNVQGRGIASRSLNRLRALLPGRALTAFVVPQNERSVRLFTGAGFEPTGDNWYRSSHA